MAHVARNIMYLKGYILSGLMCIQMAPKIVVKRFKI